ncbi:MAG: SAF domain-containing protein [Actinomycetota bacterium]
MSDNAVRARLRDASPEDVDDDVAPPRTRRRTPELLLGLLLVIGGSLAGIVLFQRDDVRSTVVGTARILPRGTIIDRSDLVALEVGAMPAYAATSAAEAATLVGKRVLVDLPAGVPIPGHVVTDQQLLGGSQALIPIALERGAVPSGLGRGDLIRVIISFPNRGVDAPIPEVLSETMEVFDITTPDDFDDDVRITVRASADLAIDLARADRIQAMKVAGQ